MKVIVTGSLCLKSNNSYVLTIKFIDGDKILPGYYLESEDNPAYNFKIKSLTLGTYNYDDNSFDIVIEPPSVLIKEFEGKVFVKK